MRRTILCGIAGAAFALLVAGGARASASSDTAAKSSDTAAKHASASDTAAKRAPASSDSTATRKLAGGKEGTVMESITVEGEDRVHVEFDRPKLAVDLDPATAPGLEWDSVGLVLDPSKLDLVEPLVARSAFDRTTFIARPWLHDFREDEVATFRPKLEGVAKWALVIGDSRGETVKTFSGNGKPPEQIGWNGRDKSGKPMPPGIVYSYALEASDKAGNARRFVGPGFQLPPYVTHDKQDVSLLFPITKLDTADPGQPATILLDAASRINQLGASRPVRVEVTAASFQRANSIANSIVASLKPLLLGDPARVMAGAKVAPGAANQGTVAITVGH